MVNRPVLTLGTPAKVSALRTATLALGLGAAVCVPAAMPNSSLWTTPLLIFVPVFLSILMLRHSVISAAYLAQVALYFGVTSLILGSSWEPALVSAVLAWSLAITIGTLVGGLALRQRSPRESRTWMSPHAPHYWVCVALIAVSAYLALSGRTGYAAQLATGQSTPSGILGTLSSVAPVMTLTLLLTALGSGRGTRTAVGLAGAQMMVLALTGFRGAGGVFIIAGLVGAALTLPPNSEWRRKSRLLVVLPALLIATALTFAVGASIKSSAAEDLGQVSSGTELFTLSNTIEKTAERLELAQPLDKAIEYRDVPAAQEAVSWRRQIGAAIPRILWPDKPIVDYGHQISIVIYDLGYAQSSSTVTTVGDSLINFGMPGLIVVGLLAGLSFRFFTVQVKASSRGAWVLICAAVVSSAVGQEQGVILMLVEMLRHVLVVGALWAMASLVAGLSHPTGEVTPGEVAASRREPRARPPKTD